jgi:RNA polymerase sigma-70 factor (ECF subfamily)
VRAPSTYTLATRQPPFWPFPPLETRSRCHGREGEGIEGESSVALLARARGGDRQALDRLCARYLPRLRRWASGRLPQRVRGSLDTDDLVQDTILRQVMHNRIREQIRRTARRPGRACLDDEVRDGAPSPLDRAVGREELERYEAALGRLRPGDRELVVLRIELGCDYAEVAEATDRPNAHAARMAVSRALMRLAEELARA